jgi:hypothetical protein
MGKSLIDVSALRYVASISDKSSVNLFEVPLDKGYALKTSYRTKGEARLLPFSPRSRYIRFPGFGILDDLPPATGADSPFAAD